MHGYNAAMFRLTREVRFAVNSMPDQQFYASATNSFAGYPSLCGFGQYLTLSVTLGGELRPESSYLRNIKDIDDAVRRIAIPIFITSVREGQSPVTAIQDVSTSLADAWPGASVEQLMLSLSPFLSLIHRSEESPMLRLSQKFEFSASHRLYNRDCDDAENRRIFGKCSNPNGHGHNYELQVTLAGDVNAVGGALRNLPDFERLVGEAVIERFDHKNLNLDLPEFADLIPSVENIARVIYRLLRPRFDDAGAKLAAVTVWETPKTWCEYSE
jgi:6-pyruvoyltetrahydropterin/6-carboxytetrahydropterin synthase